MDFDLKLNPYSWLKSFQVPLAMSGAPKGTLELTCNAQPRELSHSPCLVFIRFDTE